MANDPNLEFETELLVGGASFVIGVDEVGRGAIAGPVTVGIAVINSAVQPPVGLRDSKMISAKRRESLIEPIVDWTFAVEVGEATASEIDEFGIVPCLGRAAERAFAKLQMRNVDLAGAAVILDGSHNWLRGTLTPEMAVHTRVKADRDCAVVAAASVFAKVHRDSFMVSQAENEPRFGWDSNKGYGSSLHMSAISEFGPSDLHRKTWLSSVSHNKELD